MNEQEMLDKKLEEIKADVGRWSAECETLPAFALLPEACREYFPTITAVFAEAMFREHQCAPAKWTSPALGQVLVEVLPERLHAPLEVFAAICPVLSVFIEYLYQIGVRKSYEALCKRLAQVEHKMLKNAAKELAQPEEGGEAEAYIPPTSEQWADLYEVAGQIKAMEPWEYLWDAEIITLILPGYAEPVYCSVLGGAGEAYGIVVYLGDEGFRSFIRLVSAPPEEPSFIAGLGQKCLVLHFGDREELDAEDRKAITALGLKFRGRGNWVYFRAMEPGYLPWYLDTAQAALLTEALRNLYMACRYYLEGTIEVDFEEGETLLRFYSEEKKSWFNTVVPLPPVAEAGNRAIIVDDDLLLARMKKARRNQAELEFDALRLPMPVQERRGERPRLPWMLLLIDRQNWQAIDQYMAESDDEAIGETIEILADYIEKYGRPRCIFVRNEDSERVIGDFCRRIGIPLRHSEGMAATDSLIAGLLEYIR